MSIINYLKENNAQKQINKLVKKYENKKIILYGAGEFFGILNENYDISKLNIVGIADKKFEDYEQDTFCGYKVLSPDVLKNYEYDVIITTLYDNAAISNILEYKILINTINENKPVVSIIEPTFKYILKTLFGKTNEKVIITKKIKYRYLKNQKR